MSVMRQRASLTLAYYRYISQPRVLHFSTTSFPILSFQKKKYQNTLFLQTSSFERQLSFFNKISNKIKNIISDKTKASVGAYLTFEKIGDDIDYNAFFNCFQLPDTFQSWFLCIQLHVWMAISATISKKQGKTFRNSIIDAMWNDVEQRLDELVKQRSSQKKKILKELVAEFQACLIAYDEGILSDDTVLAAAVWRMLFSCKPVDPEILENSVFYIRKQLSNIEAQDIEKIMFKGSVTFLPLVDVLSLNKEHLE